MSVQNNYAFLYIYTRNATNPTIYDLATGPDTTQLSYVRLTEPRQEYLIENGAKYALESFKNQEKIFYTGIRPLTGNWYSGDAYNGTKRYAVLAYLLTDLAAIALVILPYPKKNKRQYLLNEIKKAHYSKVPHLLSESRSNNSNIKIAK